jgi:hypothetical protein
MEASSGHIGSLSEVTLSHKTCVGQSGVLFHSLQVCTAVCVFSCVIFGVLFSFISVYSNVEY